jgi:hypothetical protein
MHQLGPAAYYPRHEKKGNLTNTYRDINMEILDQQSISGQPNLNFR